MKMSMTRAHSDLTTHEILDDVFREVRGQEDCNAPMDEVFTALAKITEEVGWLNQYVRELHFAPKVGRELDEVETQALRTAATIVRLIKECLMKEKA